jgi:2-dehydro-3-deoxyphosphogluconate aldolase / (4S)-4-hydroxy-2-oxoglutarate aldolase
VLNRDQIKNAIAAGAQYGFMPHVDTALIGYGRDQDWPIHPGALTPTEMMTAWNAGASGVKVFPVAAMGGCEYIRSLQGPLSHIPLIPTGGVTLENTKHFLEAGAIAVGLSGELFSQSAVAQQDWEEIAARAQRLMQSLGY